MKKLRQIHLYLGVLFAPSILFFAITGAYQTFRWNENGVAGALEPALAQMASIHKNAALQNSERRKSRPEAALQTPPRAERPAESEPAKTDAAKAKGETEREAERESEESSGRDRALPLKIYIFLMSLGLVASTATGVALAFKYNRSRRLIWGLLATGALLPLGLLFIR